MSSAALPSPDKLLFVRPLLFLAAMSLIGACGMVDYSLKNANFSSVAQGNGGNIGTVTFHYTNDEKPYVMQVSKLRGGYGLQAPLTASTDENNTNLVFSRTHEYKYFVGIQTKYSF